MRFRNPLTGECIDVDVGGFIRLPLYRELKQNAQLLGIFGNLTALLLSNESVILFKSVTERERDIDDIVSVVETGEVNWDRLIEIAARATERELEEKGARGVVLVYEVFISLKRVSERHPSLVPLDILKRIERVAGRYYELWLKHATRNSLHRERYENEDRLVTVG